MSQRMAQNEETEEVIHIALGKDFKSERPNLLWVLNNFPQAVIIIVHVHWPSKWIPFMGAVVSEEFANDKEKAIHKQKQKEKMLALLHQYGELCAQRKVRVLQADSEDVFIGIQDLVKKHQIKRLVMGSGSMAKKESLRCCQIWVVRNGKHVYTTEALPQSSKTNAELKASQESSSTPYECSEALPQSSKTNAELKASQESSSTLASQSNESQGYVASSSDQKQAQNPSCLTGAQVKLGEIQGAMVGQDDSHSLTPVSSDLSISHRHCRAKQGAVKAEVLMEGEIMAEKNDSQLTSDHLANVNKGCSQSLTQERVADINLLRAQVNELDRRLRIAEEKAHMASKQSTANLKKKSYTKKRNQDLGPSARVRESSKLELQATSNFHPRSGSVHRSRHNSTHNPKGNQSQFENQQEIYIDKLERKLKIAEEEAYMVKQSKLSFNQEGTTLKAENSAERRSQEPKLPAQVREFCKSELKRATNNFNIRNKIGEGGFGPVYKGKYRGGLVAIKKFNPEGKQSLKEFQQEVLVLSRVQHPNIIKLIGVCSEHGSLIYEYLPNGNLGERLARGLSWQDRIRIISEQRSALICLHSSKPDPIVHADIKFANILLDANDNSRLGDFGTARLIRQDLTQEAIICHDTNPMGTFGYMDPVFLNTGQLTPEADVYSFGIIVLKLLTRLPELNIVEQVKEAFDRSVQRHILDESAGHWPVVQVEQLLSLALRCCEFERRKRPSLMCKEWRTLDILQAMAAN